MSAFTSTSFAIVIPAYNEAATITEVIHSARRYCNNIIVVNDSSTDATHSLASLAKAIVINHKSNRGKANALLTGFKKAKELGVDFVITMDGDNQHHPDGIQRLLTAYESHGPDIFLIAARLEGRENAPKSRRRANKIADFWIGWAAGVPMVDSQSGYRLYPQKLLEKLPPFHPDISGFVFESEVIIDASRWGMPIAFVPTKSVYPEARRKSHFRGGFDITRITLMVARKLFFRMMMLPGLYRSITLPPHIINS
jgi:glycosyltransferase involved in cell wall biosynthesis